MNSFSTFNIHEIGQIKEIKKAVIKISGLTHCMNGEVLQITPRTRAMILGFDHDEASALLIGAGDDIRLGDKVYSQQESFKIPVGPEYLGRVVNSFVEPLDGKGPVLGAADQYFIFRDAPGIMQRVPLTRPLETGILSIDATIPIGKGQRQLIVGDRILGKVSVCTDIMINQKGKGVVCIYCSIGRSYSSLERVVKTLKDNGAMGYSIVLAATAGSSVGEQYIAPYVACTMGEYFMDQGKDVLIVFDDMTKHAWAYRQISLLLERMPGRDAYPGDIFYIHSQLMERAGQLSPEFKGGSMTFLPIVETIQGDITGYIPSNLVSMTDGQIYMSTPLFSAGFRPAIDLSLSVSRIGNKVQCPAMRQLSGTLRLEYLQYQETIKMSRLKIGTSEDVSNRLRRGESISRIFVQDRNHPYAIETEIFLLYALRRNILDVITPEKIDHFKKNILNFAYKHYSSLVNQLSEEKTLTLDIAKGMDECLVAFFKQDS